MFLHTKDLIHTDKTIGRIFYYRQKTLLAETKQLGGVFHMQGTLLAETKQLGGVFHTQRKLLAETKQLGGVFLYRQEKLLTWTKQLGVFHKTKDLTGTDKTIRTQFLTNERPYW